MKAHTAYLKKTVLTSFLAGLVSASLTMAADPTPAPPAATGVAPSANPGAGGPAGGGGRGNFQGMRGMAFGLDDQQRQLVMEAMQKDKDAMAKLEEKLRAAQKELMQAVLAEKYDEKTVQEKAELVAKIQTELTVLRSKALATVAPTLKPEQRQEMENSQLGAMFLTTGRLNFMGMGGFGGNANMGGRGQRGAGSFDPAATGGAGGRRGGGNRGGQGGGGGGRGGQGGGGQP